MSEIAWAGLDIGGAHLKAALLDPAGAVQTARQVPCALWQGLDRLETALATVLAGAAPRNVAVTMTGELVDLFPDRATGVTRLIGFLEQHLAGAELAFWTARDGFVDAAAALDRPLALASANWSATCAVVATRLPEGLLVDIGSTTADLVPFCGGVIQARGWSDRERLTAEELIYSGATRTPLMALCRWVPFLGERVAVMNEHFATTADVWRVLGLLAEAADQHPAADDGAKTVEASARRLARMIGSDLADGSAAAWRGLAQSFAQAQEHALLQAAERQLSRSLLSECAPLVAAGSGSFLVHRLAARLERPCRDFAELVVTQAAAEVATCAPAVAVALLASAARTA